MPSPGVKNPAPSASQLCSVTGFLHFSLILSKGKSQTLWPGWETHEHRASGSSLSFGNGNSQEKRLCSNWHLWATAINEWVAHTGEGGSLSAHPMWSSPFVRENQKLPKKLSGLNIWETLTSRRLKCPDQDTRESFQRHPNPLILLWWGPKSNSASGQGDHRDGPVHYSSQGKILPLCWRYLWRKTVCSFQVKP